MKIIEMKTETMENRKKENSVKSLTSLYTVVVGVALSLAIVGLIDPKRGLESVSWSPLLLFISFVATLFPFYHGALRHLDDAYIENDSAHIKDGALIIDFVLLFLHGIAFVILSLLLTKPGHFAWVLVALLTIDVVWGLFAHFASSARGKHTAEWKWTSINFVFVGLAVWYLIDNEIFMKDLSNPIKLSFPIAFACVARTVVDYIWCRSFYFPVDKKRTR